MSLALGPVARFMTREFYSLLETRSSWCEFLAVPNKAREELLLCEDCLQEHSSQPIWHSPSAVRCVYSDTSDTGYGGYTVEHGMHIELCLPNEAKQSSTWRELVAVGRVLMSVAKKLRNIRVCWFTDNQNVIRILKVGSCKPHLQVEALKVLKACVANKIRLEREWVPREKNQLADYFSRLLIMTTDILTRKCTNCWMQSGVHTRWTGLLHVITHRSSNSIPDMHARMQKRWTLLQ